MILRFMGDKIKMRTETEFINQITAIVPSKRQLEWQQLQYIVLQEAIQYGQRAEHF